MLLIEAPLGHLEAKKYSIGVLFGTFLGLEFTCTYSTRTSYRISSLGSPLALTLPDVFFNSLGETWPNPKVIPTPPLEVFDVRVLKASPTTISNGLPILFGEKKDQFTQSPNHFHLPIDVIGSAFFMLSRYEESISKVIDDHDRFPSRASIGAQEDFLDRPLVDEYVEILWSILSTLWPSITRKKREPKTFVTCDVDLPYQTHLRSTQATIRVAAGHVLKRHSLAAALESIQQHLQIRRGCYTHDPFHKAVSWIMEINEKYGHTVSFYFIAEGSNSRYDHCYSLDEPPLRAMFGEIRDRGHQVGLHPSYESFEDAKRIRHEADLLRAAMAATGIRQDSIGGRQHYLRWSNRTPALLEQAGLDYDSTLCYPDRAGFRTGTSHEYPMYDILGNRPLRIWQRPLIAAESIIVSDTYMGMGTTEVAMNYFSKLRQRCHLFGGTFTLLWHNSSLLKTEERRMYEEILALEK